MLPVYVFCLDLSPLHLCLQAAVHKVKLTIKDTFLHLTHQHTELKLPSFVQCLRCLLAF